MWACLAIVSSGCVAAEPPDAGIDAAPIVDARVGRRRDIGIDTGIDPWAPRDAFTYDAPYPDLDCDDPAFWSAEVVSSPLRELQALTFCYPQVPWPVFTFPVRGNGYGDLCVRVHASNRPELPVGVTRVPRGGGMLGIAAPAEIDLEIREWTFRESDGWVIASQRWPNWIAPRPSTLVVGPEVWVVGPNITHLVRSATITTTEAADMRTGVRRTHGPLLAVGTIGDAIAWVRDEDPPVVELLDDDLVTLAEHTWDAPIDGADFVIVPFGVLSGDHMLRFVAREAEMRLLPARMDEIAPSGRGASGRSGDQGWTFGADGEVWLGPTGVGEIAGSGEHLSTDRRLFGSVGPVGSSIDSAIGHVIAIVRQPTQTIAVGEYGVAQLRGPEPYLGGGTHLFDPVGVGVATAWQDRILSRRPDGVMVSQSFIELEVACE